MELGRHSHTGGLRYGNPRRLLRHTPPGTPDGTRTDCPQAAHLIGQCPVKLGSSDCPIRYGRFPKTLPVSAVVFSHHNRGALDVRNYRMGSVSYLEAVLLLCTRHQLRQLLARVEHARLHGRLVDANDFRNLLDRLAVVVN